MARANCPSPSGTHACSWIWVGGLGGGASFTGTPIKTAGSGGGYDFFALVQVSDYGQTRVGHPYNYNAGDSWDHCPDGGDDPNHISGCNCAFNNGNPARAWYTWAVSKSEATPLGNVSGLKWQFVAATGGLTTIPRDSIKLLRRDDLANARYITTATLTEPCGLQSPWGQDDRTGGGWGDRFGKPSIFYNKYDNYFYMSVQWGSGNTTAPGMKKWSSVLFRMLFDPSHQYGLGPVERLVNAGGGLPFTNAACSGTPVGCGVIPSDDSWIAGATYPGDATVPGSMSTLYTEAVGVFKPAYGSRNFDSHLYHYTTGADSQRWRKGTSRTFPFFTGSAQSIDFSPLAPPNGIHNETCFAPDDISFGSGNFGNFRTAVQQKFPAHVNDAAETPGAPSLLGYIAGHRSDLGPCPNGSPSTGLIPVHLELGPRPATFPVLQSISPMAGIATGSVLVTLQGATFTQGATIKIGGSNATNVVWSSSSQMTARSPSLAAGNMYDVVVTNPNGQTNTLFDSYLADFTDVPSVGPGSTYYASVVRLARHHVVSGCSGGAFCPLNTISRGQMAVFLLKAKYGSIAYVPPPATGTVFTDVPANHQFAAWIEQLAREGITAGCTATTFCPNDPVKRQQMAVFLLKAINGQSYNPPTCAGIFSDVACPSLFANWIEAAANQSIMPGGGPSTDQCSVGGTFCPTVSVNRGPMAKHVIAGLGTGGKLP